MTKGIKVCKKCGNKILPEQKGVLLNTFIGENNLEKVYWHWECYLTWFNEKIFDKSKNMLAQSVNLMVPQNVRDDIKKMLNGNTINLETN